MGQAVSFFGTWMHSVGVSWLVYRLSHSALLLGVVGFAADLPGFLLMPLAGVIADRVDRRRLIIATQVLAMVQAFVLTMLVFTDVVRIWHVVVLSLFLGVINAFDLPTRQAFVVQLISRKEDLLNAIALNSVIFNLARLLGPTLAGVVIALLGEGPCFLANGLSYLPVVIVLLRMQLPAYRANLDLGSPVAALAQGLSYSYRFVPIRNTLLLIALVSVMGLPYTVILPILADDILHGGSRTLGFLVGAGGFGALIGALYMASRKTVLGLGKLIPLAAVLFSGGLMLLAVSRHVLLSAAAMPVIGFGLMTQLAASNTLIQTLVDEDKRGRVMGIYTMAVRGMVPIGSLLVGGMSSILCPSSALALGAFACAFGALLFRTQLPAMRRFIRPIYVQQGIIPDVTQTVK